MGEVPQKSKPPAALNQKPTKPVKNNKKLFWFLGCCCGGGCFLVVLIIVLLNLSFLSAFFVGGDTPVITPYPTSTHTPVTHPTTTSEATDNNNGVSCTPLALVDAVPLQISSDNPGFHQEIKNHYYQIYGLTPNEINAQMYQCGVKNEEGNFAAYTSWYVNWQYSYTDSVSGCAIRNLAVGANVEYFYPKWEDPGDAEQGVAAKWENFMKNLVIHEEGHGQNGLDAAHEVYSTLSNYPSQANCDSLVNQANQTGRNIVDWYSTKDKEYDDATNHGETQGAVFP